MSRISAIAVITSFASGCGSAPQAVQVGTEPVATATAQPPPIEARFGSLRWGNAFSESAWIDGGYKTRQENGYGLFADYVVVNRSTRALEISQEGAELRCFRARLLKDGVWTEIPFTWCGTGSMSTVLQPGRQTLVSLPVPAGRIPVQFGIVLFESNSGAEVVAWTEELMTSGG